MRRHVHACVIVLDLDTTPSVNDRVPVAAPASVNSASVNVEDLTISVGATTWLFQWDVEAAAPGWTLKHA